jgi:SAM-dependent methyltransferase
MTEITGITLPRRTATVAPIQVLGEADLIRYYSEAGPDYEAWSPAFNMHFGYAAGNPFARETMLERMNQEVLRRAGVGEPGVEQLVDLGCGLGATARHAVARFPQVHVTGVTVVPWQVRRGSELAARVPGGNRIELLLADYQATGLASKSFDAAYAIESSCYGEEAGKAKLLGEAHRLLRRGGRLVVADGFLKRPPEEMGRVSQRLVRGIRESWAIRELGQLAEFVQELECAGFGDVKVEDLRWRVAPSAMQIPLVTARFLFTELLIKRSRMTRERWNNVLGPMYGLLLALLGREMSYYLISATKN